MFIRHHFLSIVGTNFHFIRSNQARHCNSSCIWRQTVQLKPNNAHIRNQSHLLFNADKSKATTITIANLSVFFWIIYSHFPSAPSTLITTYNFFYRFLFFYEYICSIRSYDESEWYEIEHSSIVGKRNVWFFPLVPTSMCIFVRIPMHTQNSYNWTKIIYLHIGDGPIEWRRTYV